MHIKLGQQPNRDCISGIVVESSPDGGVWGSIAEPFTKDVKAGGFRFLSLAFGFGEVGNRLTGSESV